MTRRNRLLSFGASVALIVLGAVADPLFGGITGEAVAIALASLGGIAIVSLVFLEVGLSEDRERARESATKRERERPLQRIRRRPPLRRRRP
jgi:hypothetical protein